MVKAMKLRIRYYVVANDTCQFRGRQPRKNSLFIAFDGAILGKKPVHQRILASQFVTNDGGPQGDRIRFGMQLANILRLTVEIFRVGDILFGV
ncbi:hypothetical protein D3C71_1608390 [compost metagenome]